jgi:hypothetical protein
LDYWGCDVVYKEGKETKNLSTKASEQTQEYKLWVRRLILGELSAHPGSSLLSEVQARQVIQFTIENCSAWGITGSLDVIIDDLLGVRKLFLD